MVNILSIAGLVILLILLPLAVILYPVMGVVFLVEYLKTKKVKLLLVGLLNLVPLLLILGIFVDIYSILTLYGVILGIIAFVIFFIVSSFFLGIIFIKKYSETKIKKYRLLGWGYLLFAVLVLSWSLINYIEYHRLSPQCYVAPPPNHLFFNNTLSPELASYKESLTEKFAGNLPENVVEKISKK